MNTTASSVRPLLKWMGVPEKFLPKRRIGQKSSDGVAFVLNDESKVGKLILCKYETDYYRAEREFLIGRAMGRKGIGPKVYTFYGVNTSMVTRHVNKNFNNKKLLSGENELELDQIVKNIVIKKRIFSKKIDDIYGFVFIVMDNLGYNVKKIQTLREYLKQGHAYPTNSIRNLHKRMENSGVVHGNLHRSNIIVITDNQGKVKVYFIDFGRSLMFNKTVFNRTNLGNPIYINDPRYRRGSGSHLFRMLNRNKLKRNLFI